MKRSLAIPVWGLALGALMLWFFASWNARIASRDAGTIREARAVLEASRPFHARITRLQQLAQEAQKTAQEASQRAQTASSALRTLASRTLPVGDTTAVPRATVDKLVALGEERDSLRLVTIAALELQARAERERANQAVAQVNALEAQLRAVLTVADCRLLGLRFAPRCPSRTASLVLGLGVGAVVGLTAH